MSEHTPGPWEFIPSNENHGPYVVGPFGGDVCDCYTMSNLSDRSVRNGGTSRPIPFQQESADANARLIAAAPDMLAALKDAEKSLCYYVKRYDQRWDGTAKPESTVGKVRAAIAKAESSTDTTAHKMADDLPEVGDSLPGSLKR